MSSSLQPHGLQHDREANSWSLLKSTSIESMMPSNHLILCHSLLLLPSIFPCFSVFSKQLTLPIRWLKCWSFNFSISPCNEYSGLISSSIDWVGLLAVSGTLKESFPTPQFKHTYIIFILKRFPPYNYEKMIYRM